MDHLPIGGAGSAFGKIVGVNPDLLHQELRVPSQLGHEIGKETQNPGMHDVEYLAGPANPDPATKSDPLKPPPISRPSKRICPKLSSGVRPRGAK